MNLKAVLFAVPFVLSSLFTTSAFAANECVLKGGTDLEVYQVGNDRIVLTKRSAARRTGSNLRTDVTNKQVMKQTALVEKLDYYNSALRLTSKLPLSIVKQEVRRESGSSCEQRGLPSHDPDINCDADNFGYWARTVLTLQDTYGNVWTYWNETEMLPSASAVPADVQLLGKLRSELKKECSKL